MSNVEAKRDQLLALIAGLESCAVAFSGGVDSAVVAKAAALTLGDRAVAVTGNSNSLAAGELEQASELAALIGIRHEVLNTREFSDPNYVRNAPDRCYYCKTELYTQLQEHLPRMNVAVILNGANVDDADDFRPGMRAASEFQVRSPLVECGINKAEVRELAAMWQLPVWDKPATPCLSSRIAYGEEVTAERVAMIDAAEQFLRQRGMRIVRVRYHQGDVARIEVPVAELPRFCQEPFRREFVEHLRATGFKYITLDLEGFRSGSFQALIPAESLTRLSASRD